MPFSTLKFKALLALLFFIGILHKADATHLLGTELSYEHISGDTFLVKLKIYRDCHGIALSQTPFRVTPKGKAGITINGNLYGGTDVTPVCKSHCTTCKSLSCTSDLGIEEYLMDAIVVLPDCEYTIAWEQCCRSSNITTGAADQNYYTEIKLNKCITGNSSSPAFLTRPYIVGCANQCTSVLQGAMGNPGDSLVHKFAAPLSDAITQVPYANGYSYDQPFLYQAYPNKDSAYNYPICNGLHINAESGELNFKAVQEDVTIMVIEVEQWHKDSSGVYQKIATIRKDALLNLMPCLSASNKPNNQPLLSGADSTNNFEIHLCANDTSAFTIYSHDPDKFDSVYLKWSKPIPGANFKIINNRHQKATFSWYTNNSHISSEPYRFIVRAEDNLCPLPSYVEKQFKIFVHPEIPDFHIKKVRGKCNQYSFGIQAAASLKKYSYQWYINDSLVGKDSVLSAYTFTKPGRNVVRFTVDGNCTKHAFDTIDISPIKAIFNNKSATVCQGDTFALTANGGQLFSWNSSPYMSEFGSATVKLFPPVSTVFYVKVTDTLTNCMRTDSFRLVVNKVNYTLPDKKIGLCHGDTARMTISSAPNKVFSWSPNNNIALANTASPKFFPSVSTMYYVKITDTLTGCVAKDSVMVQVGVLNYTVSGSGKICAGDSVTLNVTGGNKFKWMPNTNITNANSATPKVYPLTSTTYYIEISDTTTGCTKYDSVSITVDTSCVWPGDANLDKTADYLDILDIALGYAATGIPRVNASTDWKPQASKNWNQSLASGINYKHLDTNGDSVINSDDTFAVVQNYGKTHLKNEEAQLTGNPNDPPLYFTFDKKYYIAGETVKATLYLGREDKPVKDVYGLGLKHFFASPYMQTGTYNFTWNCEMLCGTKDNFQLYRQFNDKGTGEGSLIRTDKMTTSRPFGKVADIKFILKDSTFSYTQTETNISLEILKSRLIDMNGNEIPVYTEANNVKVYRSQKDVVGLEDIYAERSSVMVYPNPANNIVYIQSSGEIFNQVSIVNLLGETLIKDVQNHTKASINVANLPAGIYIVQVKLKNQLVQQKLVITK